LARATAIHVGDEHRTARRRAVRPGLAFGPIPQGSGIKSKAIEILSSSESKGRVLCQKYDGKVRSIPSLSLIRQMRGSLYRKRLSTPRPTGGEGLCGVDADLLDAAARRSLDEIAQQHHAWFVGVEHLAGIAAVHRGDILMQGRVRGDVFVQ